MLQSKFIEEQSHKEGHYKETNITTWRNNQLVQTIDSFIYSCTIPMEVIVQLLSQLSANKKILMNIKHLHKLFLFSARHIYSRIITHNDIAPIASNIFFYL